MNRISTAPLGPSAEQAPSRATNLFLPTRRRTGGAISFRFFARSGAIAAGVTSSLQFISPVTPGEVATRATSVPSLFIDM